MPQRQKKAAPDNPEGAVAQYGDCHWGKGMPHSPQNADIDLIDRIETIKGKYITNRRLCVFKHSLVCGKNRQHQRFGRQQKRCEYRPEPQTDPHADSHPCPDALKLPRTGILARKAGHGDTQSGLGK